MVACGMFSQLHPKELAKLIPEGDGIKVPEMGTTLDPPGGPVSSQGPYKREVGGSEAEEMLRCWL